MAVSQWSEFSLKYFKPIILASIFNNFKRPCLFARRTRTFRQAFGRGQGEQTISLREELWSPDFERNRRCDAIAIRVISFFPVWRVSRSSGFPFYPAPDARFKGLIEGRSFSTTFSQFVLRFSRVVIISVYYGLGVTCPEDRSFI